MLKSFDANADPPSINKLKDQFRVLEANLRQAQLVTTSPGFVTMTSLCDHWTSIAKKTYCGVTAHRIDDNFNLHFCTMECWFHEWGSAAEELIIGFLINLFKDYEFDLKKVIIVAFVTDTSRNMSKLVIMMKSGMMRKLEDVCQAMVVQTIDIAD
jgi:hypothetical protein